MLFFFLSINDGEQNTHFEDALQVVANKFWPTALRAPAFFTKEFLWKWREHKARGEAGPRGVLGMCLQPTLDACSGWGVRIPGLRLTWAASGSSCVRGRVLASIPILGAESRLSSAECGVTLRAWRSLGFLLCGQGCPVHWAVGVLGDNMCAHAGWASKGGSGRGGCPGPRQLHSRAPDPSSPGVGQHSCSPSEGQFSLLCSLCCLWSQGMVSLYPLTSQPQWTGKLGREQLNPLPICLCSRVLKGSEPPGLHGQLDPCPEQPGSLSSPSPSPISLIWDRPSQDTRREFPVPQNSECLHRDDLKGGEKSFLEWIAAAKALRQSSVGPVLGACAGRGLGMPWSQGEAMGPAVRLFGLESWFCCFLVVVP